MEQNQTDPNLMAYHRRQNLRSTNPSSGSRKSLNQKPTNPLETFHGLVVYYEDGTYLLEKNHYFCPRQNKNLATNWSEIPKSNIESLELRWEGSPVIKLEAIDIEGSYEWLFSHTGCVDMSTGSTKPRVLSRNIGYIQDGVKKIYRVDEKTGMLNFEER